MIHFVRHVMENQLLVSIMGTLIVIVPIFGIPFIHRVDTNKSNGKNVTSKSKELL